MAAGWAECSAAKRIKVGPLHILIVKLEPDPVIAEAASLQAELAGLQAMERQVSRSLSAMKVKKRRQEFGNTITGRVYNVIGYIFALYCAARVLMVGRLF